MCIALACLTAAAAESQVVNVDREVRDDSVHHRWGAFVNLSASSDKQKKNILDVSGNVEIDRYFDIAFSERKQSNKYRFDVENKLDPCSVGSYCKISRLRLQHWSR